MIASHVSHILVPIDFGHGSESALRFAKMLTAKFGSHATGLKLFSTELCRGFTGKKFSAGATLDTGGLPIPARSLIFNPTIQRSISHTSPTSSLSHRESSNSATLELAGRIRQFVSESRRLRIRTRRLGSI